MVAEKDRESERERDGQRESKANTAAAGGYTGGPHILLTMRKIEDELSPALYKDQQEERDKKRKRETKKGKKNGKKGRTRQRLRTIEERSRGGVLGRLVDGLWTKLLEVSLVFGMF
jgi:hypothetical protein